MLLEIGLFPKKKEKERKKKRKEIKVALIKSGLSQFLFSIPNFLFPISDIFL